MAIRFVKVETPQAQPAEAPPVAGGSSPRADRPPARDPARPEEPSPPGPPVVGPPAAERMADAPLLDPALFPEIRVESRKAARPRRHRRGFGG